MAPRKRRRRVQHPPGRRDGRAHVVCADMAWPRQGARKKSRPAALAPASLHTRRPHRFAPRSSGMGAGGRVQDGHRRCRACGVSPRARDASRASPSRRARRPGPRRVPRGRHDHLRGLRRAPLPRPRAARNDQRSLLVTFASSQSAPPVSPARGHQKALATSAGASWRRAAVGRARSRAASAPSTSCRGTPAAKAVPPAPPARTRDHRQRAQRPVAMQRRPLAPTRQRAHPLAAVAGARREWS